MLYLEKNRTTFSHLPTFLRFIIPSGYFIGPIIIWLTNKDKSEFVDAHGKQINNFQINLPLNMLVIGMFTLLILIFGFSNPLSLLGGDNFDVGQFHWRQSSSFYLFLIMDVLLFFKTVFILEFLGIVMGGLKIRYGVLYKYPLTVNFLK